MASVIHIAEVAALLAVAYVLGWGIGYVAHRLAARPKATDAVSAERLAAVMGEAPDALVKAPVIVPVANEPPPAPFAPANEPAVVVAPTVEQPLTATAAAPATATTLAPIVIPAVMPPPPMFTKSEPARAPALPVAPELVPEPVVAYTAAPAMKPGEAWTGEIKGRAALRFDVPVESVAEAAPRAEEIASEAPPEAPVIVETLAPAELRLAETAIEAPAVVDPTNAEPITTEPPAAPEPPPIAVSVAPPRPTQEYDEDAAMRAIEGGWSRTRARAMPGAPELADVGAAVAAAQTAVEQVLAQAGIDPEATRHSGKPAGLPKPRPSGKDNLKQINGLSPLDESTLNNLGVYHFDQIAAWDETEVLWMENHVFARGRIGREDWQGQARTLSSIVTG